MVTQSESSLKLDRLAWVILVAALIALVIGVSVARSATSVLDSRQILYRYAEQLHAGNGLVFNPGERALLLASPIEMILLAAFSTVFSIETASMILFAVAGIIGAYRLIRIAQRAGFSVLATGLVAVLFISLLSLLQITDETLPLAAAISLLALDLALTDRWEWAGIALTVAVLCNPEALALAPALTMLAGNRNATLRFILSLLVPLILAAIVVRVYYGPTWLNGLLIFRVGSTKISWVAALWLLLFLAATYGWYSQRQNLVASICAGWIAIYILIVGALLHVDLSGHYFFLAGPLLLLVLFAWQIIGQRVSVPVFAIGAVAALAIAIIGFRAIPPFGATKLGSQYTSFGAASTDTMLSALILQPAANQTLIAFDGQLQPGVKEMAERGDSQSMVIRYAPDVLITSVTSRIPPRVLASGALARLDYRPGEIPGVFIRHSDIGTFSYTSINLPYGPDITLVGMALDQSSLKPGQLMRIRLDWQYRRAAADPVTVDLRLESGDFALAYAADTFQPNVFSIGTWSTYHTLKVIPQAWSGPVTLDVGVSVADGVIARRTLTSLNVESAVR